MQSLPDALFGEDDELDRELQVTDSDSGSQHSAAPQGQMTSCKRCLLADSGHRA